MTGRALAGGTSQVGLEKWPNVHVATLRRHPLNCCRQRADTGSAGDAKR
jgi:hypothetical protein